MANKIISKDDISTIAALNNQPEVLKWTLELGMLPNFVGHEISEISPEILEILSKEEDSGIVKINGQYYFA